MKKSALNLTNLLLDSVFVECAAWLPERGWQTKNETASFESKYICVKLSLVYIYVRDYSYTGESKILAVIIVIVIIIFNQLKEFKAK